MDDKLQRRIQRYGWDAAASVYDDAWGAVLRPAHDVLLEMADLRPGQRVVETAAGGGLVTFRASEMVGPSGSVSATDISGKMAAKGAETAQAMGVTNVSFDRVEAEALKFHDNAFDRALCALGLMYVPEPSDALAEMARVLHPSGRAAVLVWGERQHCGWAEIFPIVDAEVQSEVCPLFFGLGSPGALVSAMDVAGFSKVEERRLTCPARFPDRASMLAAVVDGGAVALAAKRFSDETRNKVDDAFAASVEPYRVGQHYEIPGEFVVATGVA
jgi:ubiquinone/menaquinone biosynthesis C-methylase UbiE